MSCMWLADLVVLIHFLFVLFVIFGGLFVFRWPRLAWLHVPVFIWGVLIEWSGWICPLTPLENWLCRQAGDLGYERGFIAHYFLSILYPEALPRGGQYVLGWLVLLINAAIYGWIYWRNKKLR